MTVRQPESELILIDRAQQGSVDAFEKLVFKYQDGLYRFLLARAHNRADAEDALQEAFVAAYRYLPSYRPRYRFSTWLFTIAIRQLGRLSKRQPTPEEISETVSCERPGPEQLGIQAEQEHSIWRTARATLGDAQFTAMWLFYVEDMTVAEVGAAIKRPVSWVKVNLMRSRQRLGRALQLDNSEHSATVTEVAL